MHTEVNHQLVLRARPAGVVTDDNFELIELPIPSPADGQVLVRTLWLSFEPAQRGWLNDVRSYIPPVVIGEVMRSWGVGQVSASGHPDFKPGQFVHGTLHWQTHALLDLTHDTNPPTELALIPPEIHDPKLMLSVAGVTGMTAYFGMRYIGQPVEGDAVVVTAAAGATGSVAGQVARNLGAGRVIGTAGSKAKQDWVREVAGFDECVDHYDDAVRKKLRALAPSGYNVAFDNVGGALLDAVLFNIAEHGRIALCGSISTGYRPERPEVGLYNYQLLTTRSARMEGFLLYDFEDRFTEARRILLGWYEDGSLRVEHDILEDLQNAPLGLRRLFDGGNLGKQLLHVADPA